MGLISGMVMGMVVGVALMAGWSRVMQRRSRKRISKAADIKVLGSLGRDDLKKLCGDNFPEWISFPQFEQVKWLNKHLSKLWPFIDQAATAVVKESVEPLLDDYRPPGIKSLKFSKFSLGNVSPKIEGDGLSCEDCSDDEWKHVRLAGDLARVCQPDTRAVRMEEGKYRMFIP